MNESGAKSKLGRAEITDILKLLPHRYPFLMVDRIVDMDGDRSATGIKNVTANEPYFQGHFPGNPVMPGVLLIEGMAQTAGALCMRHIEEFKEPPLVYFMAIDKARFRRPGGARRYRSLSRAKDAQPRTRVALPGAGPGRRQPRRRSRGQRRHRRDIVRASMAKFMRPPWSIQARNSGRMSRSVHSA